MICWWTRRWTVNEEGGLAGEVPVAEHCECSGGGTKARLLQEARGLLLGWADRISFVNGWPEENNSRRNSKRLRIHPLFLTSICSTSYQSINTKHFCTAYTTAVIVALFMFVSQQSKALLWDCPLHLYCVRYWIACHDKVSRILLYFIEKNLSSEGAKLWDGL